MIVYELEIASAHIHALKTDKTQNEPPLLSSALRSSPPAATPPEQASGEAARVAAPKIHATHTNPGGGACRITILAAPRLGAAGSTARPCDLAAQHRRTMAKR